MQLKFTLFLLVLAPLSAQASGLFISPEVKVGSFRGAGIQIGTNDIAGFDALYFDYSQVTYTSGNFDETIDAYRLGFQHMFAHQPQMGFQASLGVADYRGSYREDKRDTKGLSVGGAYVYQVTPTLSVRAGADLDIFKDDKTHTFTDTAVQFSVGFGLRL
ncbi:hypothetical protein D1115_12440 [Vibrio alfacsensis]|uniref:Outer membrane protein beta-barrel domain-containing protein n=1 Tax=Vibrio alfacsensis TaxID=1074311 RepID=A0ABM6YVI7_9VIBR|nr:hypothetical protein [Vibrio alfacsensis]AXY01827.1 hypothetical protein D1115_12440 [Vibrio alfacsensis]